jgi:hypothetical protein
MPERASENGISSSDENFMPVRPPKKMSVNIALILRSKSDLDKKSKKTPKMLKKLSKLTVFMVWLADQHEALF